jgi:acetylxylan esterase
MKKNNIIGYLMIILILLASTGPATAAALKQITNFGNNPSNLEMHLYVPDIVKSKAPVLLAIHYCTGSGPTFFQNTGYKTLADKYGFIVIYPTATRSSKCFDVYSPAALKRDGGSDPVSMRSMIGYVQKNYDVDSKRIFATGTSSGAMATNVMLALYPDVFAAGAAFAGVPYGCFATTNGSEWNSECSGGRVIKSAQQWGDLVRNAYPGYAGQRPRMQVWHGTNDTTLSYTNFGEEIKQWTNVNGLSQTAAYTDSPMAGATRTRYGNTGKTAPVEAISFQGVGHNLPIEEEEAIRFFNLDGSSGSGSNSTNTTTDTNTNPPTGGCSGTSQPGQGGCR